MHWSLRAIKSGTWGQVSLPSISIQLNRVLTWETHCNPSRFLCTLAAVLLWVKSMYITSHKPPTLKDGTVCDCKVYVVSWEGLWWGSLSTVVAVPPRIIWSKKAGGGMQQRSMALVGIGLFCFFTSLIPCSYWTSGNREDDHSRSIDHQGKEGWTQINKHWWQLEKLYAIYFCDQQSHHFSIASAYGKWWVMLLLLHLHR